MLRRVGPRRGDRPPPAAILATAWPRPLRCLVGGGLALAERGSARASAARARQAAVTADSRRLAALAATAADIGTSSLLAVAAYRLQDSPDSRGALLTAVERNQSALWRIAEPEPAAPARPLPGRQSALRHGQPAGGPRDRLPVTCAVDELPGPRGIHRRRHDGWSAGGRGSGAGRRPGQRSGVAAGCGNRRHASDRDHGSGQRHLRTAGERGPALVGHGHGRSGRRPGPPAGGLRPDRSRRESSVQLRLRSGLQGLPSAATAQW